MESEKQEAKSEVDDEDIEEFLEDEEAEDDDVGIEDEDLTQFGVEAGEDMLRHFQALREYKESFIEGKSMNRSVLEKKDTESIFRPTTPSIKSSFVQRRPTPLQDESSSFIKNDTNLKFKQSNYDDSISMAYESRNDIENPSTHKQQKYLNSQQEQDYNGNSYQYEDNNNQNMNYDNDLRKQSNKSIVEELENNDL